LQSVSGPVAWSTRQVALPPRVITPAEVVRAEQVVAESAASSEAPRGQTDGLPELLFARAQLELAPRTAPYAAEIQAFRIGDLGVVGLPGEFFVEFGLELKRRSPAAQTFVVGLANGSLGYVPTAAAFAQGGYEPTSWHYSKLAPAAGPLCVAAALEQLQTLFA
jgi:neutral ceramidase